MWNQLKTDNRMKTGLGVALLILAGLLVINLVKNSNKGEEDQPEIVLERSKLMEVEEPETAMTETEKQSIEDAFVKEGVEVTLLKDVTGGQAAGTAWRQADELKFYHKAEVSGLPAAEKGFFYEGWLVGPNGFFSTGRMGVVGEKNLLYYLSEENRDEFRGVVITLEPEDGDPAPAGHVLEGSF